VALAHGWLVMGPAASLFRKESEQHHPFNDADGINLLTIQLAGGQGGEVGMASARQCAEQGPVV